MEWEKLEGRAYEKACRVLGPTVGRYDLHATKVGRKTVFVEDSGVLRLYVVGDDGWIYTDKAYSTMPPSRVVVYDLLDAAAKGEPILSDHRYRAPEEA